MMRVVLRHVTETVTYAFRVLYIRKDLEVTGKCFKNRVYEKVTKSFSNVCNDWRIYEKRDEYPLCPIWICQVFLYGWQSCQFIRSFKKTLQSNKVKFFQICGVLLIWNSWLPQNKHCVKWKMTSYESLIKIHQNSLWKSTVSFLMHKRLFYFNIKYS